MKFHRYILNSGQTRIDIDRAMFLMDKDLVYQCFGYVDGAAVDTGQRIDPACFSGPEQDARAQKFRDRYRQLHTGK